MKIQCPQCGTTYEEEEAMAGKKVQCECLHKFFVHDPAPAVKPTKKVSEVRESTTPHDPKNKKAHSFAWIMLIIICWGCMAGYSFLRHHKNQVPAEKIMLTETGDAIEHTSTTGEKPSKVFAPFGEPAIKVDLTEIAASPWKLARRTSRGWTKIKKPKSVDGLQVKLFNSLIDTNKPNTRQDEEDLKLFTYWNWRAQYAERLSYYPDAVWVEKIPYKFEIYPTGLFSILTAFDELEPKKEYIDWAVAHSDVMAYQKTYADENLKDAVGRVITCWNIPEVYVEGTHGKKGGNKRIEGVLSKMRKDKNLSPEAYAKAKKEYLENLINAPTPMMSGYWATGLLRTAESIYRHPELYDLEVPNMGLPDKRNSGKTYLEKADFFFKAGVEAVEYFSNHPEFWDAKRGSYVNARSKKKVDSTGKEEPSYGVKPWNRSFSLLRAQSIAMRLMNALDKEKYAPMITRYKKQMNQNLTFWKDNHRLLPFVEGTGRSWAYNWVKPESIDTCQGEDIGHATATLDLGVEIAENGGTALTPSDIRAIALHFLNHIYIPDEEDLGSHMWLPYQRGNKNGATPYRALSLVPYHRDIWPMLTTTMRKSEWHGDFDYAITTYQAKNAYFKLLQEEKARIAAQPKKNSPPSIVSATQEIKLKRNARPGQTLAKIEAEDADKNQTISYHITKGNETKQFAINHQTGELSISTDIDAFTPDAVPRIITVTAADDGFPVMHTDAHIKVTAESTTGDISTGLAIHYAFDDKMNADSLKDTSGGQYNGVFKEENGDKPKLVKDGKRTALSITSMGYVDIPEEALSSVLKKNTVTIALWMKAPNELPCPVVDARAKKGWPVLTIRQDKDNLVWSAGSLWYAPVTNDLTLHRKHIPQQWNHWVFSKDKKSEMMLIYLNGKIVASRYAAGMNLHPEKKMIIGSYTEEKHWKRRPSAAILIDDFRIYDRLLLSAEVATLFETKNNLNP